MTFRYVRVLARTMPLALSLILSLEHAHAAGHNLYRYRDQAGAVVIGATIPPEFVSKGYEILSSNGRVVEVVPPALSEAEIAVRNAARLEAAKRAEEDALLRRLYNAPEDAERARDRRVQEIEGIISLKQGKIQAFSSQIQDISSQAANIERAGRTVPEDMLERVRRLQSSVRDLQTEIAQNKIEMEAAREDFNAKIGRLRELEQKRSGATAGMSPN